MVPIVWGWLVGPMTGLYLGHRFGNVSVFPLCAVLMLTRSGRGKLLVLRGGVGDKPKEACAPTILANDFPQSKVRF